ncbi:MAG TPA: hypothetical protein VFA84_09655 [Acidimicrobiales bacterium]|nr:hypothetical protein [Acidimicrobiales bacterium]
MTSLQPREDTQSLPYVPEDDWGDDDELPVRPVRKRLGPWSLGLIGALIAAGAFYGGVLTEKHHLPATTVTAGARRTTSTTAAGGAGGAGAAAAGAGAAGGAAGAAAPTFGTVKLIDGTNVYVQDATGTIVKVTTTPQSAITVTSSGTVSSIKPGDTVIVTGKADANGVVSATSIRDAGAGGAAGAGLGFGRGGGGFGRGGGGGGGGGAGGFGGAGGGGAAGAGAAGAGAAGGGG